MNTAMPIILDGNRVRDQILHSLRPRVEALAAASRPPGLAVVLVGDDPGSQIYVRNKVKACAELGIASQSLTPPASITTGELLAIIDGLNQRPDVDAILVQLPLPPQIDAEAVILAIDPAKDVDGFHPFNVGQLSTGGVALVPCTPQGCLLLLKRELDDLAGRRALVLGRSNIVGKPMAQLLLRESATVTVAHSKTRDLAGECRRAEILVVAAGRPEMVRGDWIMPGAVVIDVGINRVAGLQPGTTRLVGDVAFAEASQVAGAITPVPGGVGPMTIAMLLSNTVTACCRQNGLPDD